MACIRSSNRFHCSEICRHRDLAEVSASFVVKDVQLPRAIDQRSIGIAIAVQVGPHKLVHARDSGERMNGREGPITVVAKHCRRPACGAQQDIQIAVRLNVESPRAGIVAGENRRRQLGLRSNIGEFLRRILAHEANTARARQDQIGLEVVIEIDRQHRLRPRRRIARSTWKRKRGPSGKTHGMRVGRDHHRQLLVIERCRSDPVPLQVLRIRQRLWDKTHRGVGRRGPGTRRQQPHKRQEGLRLFTRLRFDHGEALAETRNLHEYVAEENAANGGCRRRVCRGAL